MKTDMNMENCVIAPLWGHDVKLLGKGPDLPDTSEKHSTSDHCLRRLRQNLNIQGVVDVLLQGCTVALHDTSNGLFQSSKVMENLQSSSHLGRILDGDGEEGREWGEKR